jgi:hypothetical protein
MLLKKHSSIEGVDRAKGQVINEWGIMCDIFFVTCIIVQWE